MSLLVHALLVIADPACSRTRWFEPLAEASSRRPQPEKTEPLRFVEMGRSAIAPALPKRPADSPTWIGARPRASGRRRPENAAPFSRGNTPEQVVGGRATEAASAARRRHRRRLRHRSRRRRLPDSPRRRRPCRPAQQPASTATATRQLGQSLRNLQQFFATRTSTTDGADETEQSADIQFDSKGVDFGPWLRRFMAQVKRNWIVPQAAMALQGRVVIQFYVLRNGTITDLQVVQPSPMQPFTTSAFNALKLSNPTAPLPPEYPDDRRSSPSRSTTTKARRTSA